MPKHIFQPNPLRSGTSNSLCGRLQNMGDDAVKVSGYFAPDARKATCVICLDVGAAGLLRESNRMASAAREMQLHRARLVNENKGKPRNF